MAHATLHGRRVPRLWSAVIAALLLGLVSISLAQPAGKDKDKKDKKAPGKLPVAPPPLQLTIVGKDSQDQGTTAEMVKLINTKIADGWVANKVVPSRWADDYEFIRRVSLDIIGRIAKPEEIAAFLKDPAATRRSLLIERLLASDEYPRHWSDMWANWLLTRTGVFGRGKYREAMKEWLEDQFAQNKAYSEIVQSLLTATGPNTDGKTGATNFILAHLGEGVPQAKQQEDGHFEMVPITSRITRLFTGIQVQCAQCHDHPFKPSVKQEQFWRVNAYLRQVDRKGNLPKRRQDGLATLELFDNTSVNTKPMVYFEKRNLVIRQVAAEFLPRGEEQRGKKMPTELKGLDRRRELANAILDHENFPKAIVNRMWGVFLGRGFVNPVDDFNDDNKPSHPELLDGMAENFKHYGYDLKKLIRWICHSDAYNLSYVANPTNDKPEQEVLFSRAIMKSMSPEQLFESLVTATSSEDKVEEKKKAREDWLNKLVANFGDDEGNEVNFNGTIVQALMMMNGNELNNALDKTKGTMARALRKGAGAPAIRELYLSTLNRLPTQHELAEIGQKMLMRLRDKDTAAPYQDLFWALVNSNEFLLNH